MVVLLKDLGRMTSRTKQIVQYFKKKVLEVVGYSPFFDRQNVVLATWLPVVTSLNLVYRETVCLTT